MYARVEFLNQATEQQPFFDFVIVQAPPVAAFRRLEPYYLELYRAIRAIPLQERVSSDMSRILLRREAEKLWAFLAPGIPQEWITGESWLRFFICNGVTRHPGDPEQEILSPSQLDTLFGRGLSEPGRGNPEEAEIFSAGRFDLDVVADLAGMFLEGSGVPLADLLDRYSPQELYSCLRRISRKRDPQKAVQEHHRESDLDFWGRHKRAIKSEIGLNAMQFFLGSQPPPSSGTDLDTLPGKGGSDPGNRDDGVDTA